MLWQRVLTALGLLGLLLASLWHSSEWPFGLLSLLLVCIAAWEWARLSGLSRGPAVVAALGLGLVLLGSWGLVGVGQTSRWFWLLAAVACALLLPLLLQRGVQGWRRLATGPRVGLGLLLLGQAWWALLHAKAIGLGMLLSILLLVWAADIAAYFGGKRFGRRKLAPTISPGKTWEGVWSGALAVLLLSVLWITVWPPHWGPNLYSELWQLGPWLALAALLLLLALSVMGDLFESMVKRSAGRKDSSRILPGHGGLMDRFDALLPVLPLALWIVTA
ncbi:CDP-diglyceride synthetase [Serpentinimonas raichei]|jgi:phosphatidate cytidylyltransferase|uniref:Phosphatidate cytidylyltransferase n=1 Tax=Serpentinimonas raichei TaxID=1458425 RepID=A0A060NM21_9BURK|nr:phosphatidate cytidylyltransferase [Serpentinimonas raichei]BAO80573.1 CDP-diglyceride synthetase [Serpentinimonas raichei]